MAKYEGQYREELDSDDIPEMTVPDPKDGSKPFEENTFKKRYGDLRRHMQQQMSGKDAEIAKLQEALGQATRKQIKFPKSDSEVAEWVEKYPDVAKIIDTIAQRRVIEGQRTLEKRHGTRVAALEQKLEREAAQKELQLLHPDFDVIRQDPKFHDWVALQPSNISDALYKNNTDAKAAARAIDLYKQDQGIKSKRKADRASAAQSVGRTTTSAPNTRNARFSESSVEKMSAVEYEKNEEAIQKSIREGTFEYDLSGGAR